MWDLEAERNEIARAQAPLQLPPPKPILRALETVSFVVGMPGAEISKITVNTRTVTLTLDVDDVTQAEQIYAALRSIDDTLLSWNTMTPQPRGAGVQVTYIANWQQDGGES
jgi:hypothetical protein